MNRRQRKTVTVTLDIDDARAVGANLRTIASDRACPQVAREIFGRVASKLLDDRMTPEDRAARELALGGRLGRKRKPKAHAHLMQLLGQLVRARKEAS